MATWFECKVKYEKLTENGQQKAVTEPYLVDALSFTDGEGKSNTSYNFYDCFYLFDFVCFA